MKQVKETNISPYLAVFMQQKARQTPFIGSLLVVYEKFIGIL
jgi:hypothetical protein